MNRTGRRLRASLTRFFATWLENRRCAFGDAGPRCWLFDRLAARSTLSRPRREDERTLGGANSTSRRTGLHPGEAGYPSSPRRWRRRPRRRCPAARAPDEFTGRGDDGSHDINSGVPGHRLPRRPVVGGPDAFGAPSPSSGSSAPAGRRAPQRRARPARTGPCLRPALGPLEAAVCCRSWSSAPPATRPLR